MDNSFGKIHHFGIMECGCLLLGYPLGICFFGQPSLVTSTLDSYGIWEWFGIGTIIFGIMSYAILKEVPTLKTFICILLAVAIILIQVTNVIDE